ncbi:MAG TPA: molybdopterin-dependent oxidoreductase [Xanthobacteraceae bacterium]|nr:molybdopterin-dependent oxidoreductase [Xanthobacteraceae bacterium]
MRRVSRRGLLRAGSAMGTSLLLSGCDGVFESPSLRGVLDFGQWMSRNMQRLLLVRQPLAREFAPSDISQDFPVNGTTMPGGFDYFRMMTSGFSSWRLTVDGLVRRPLSFSLEEIKALPARTQITLHCCDEGWSAIGQWTGVALSRILESAELMPNARYIVFHCLDALEQSFDGSGIYYESLDLFDAFHPQTILAYGMNGGPLPVPHGAPLRLRVERQIGYKSAKYVTRIEAVDRLDTIGRGRGGFWEDRGYQWYAGL